MPTRLVDCSQKGGADKPVLSAAKIRSRCQAARRTRVLPERDGAEHRYLYIEELPEHAGHALHTVFVDDLDERIESIGARGIEPASQETYGNGMYKDNLPRPDGNEIGFGGALFE